MTTSVPDGVRRFLAGGPLAHVVTLNPDGTPHVTLAWAGVIDDEIVLATFFDQHKIDNLRRDPRITLSFETTEPTDEFLTPYLVIRGRATVTAGGAPPVMDRLAETYIGPGQGFPMPNMPDGFVIRVAVERYYGRGPWRTDR